MIQQLDVPVSVTWTYDHRQRISRPVRIVYDGRSYPARTLGYHHTFREGRVLYHVFSVAAPTVFFRLVLNTETLNWRLTEVHDAEVN